MFLPPCLPHFWEAMPPMFISQSIIFKSQGSKLKAGISGQALCCLNHYPYPTSNPGLLPDQILKRLPRSSSALLVLFSAKRSLSLAWPFDQKSGRGGEEETEMCWEALWNQARSTQSQRLSDAPRGQGLCSGSARREADSQAASPSQVLGSLWDSILPSFTWVMWGGPLLPSLTLWQGHASIACYSMPPQSLTHPQAPSITSSNCSHSTV